LGYGDLHAGNRTAYSALDAAPAGGSWWYRVVTTGGLQSDVSPPVAVWTETPAGTARAVVRHARPDTDLALRVGSGTNPSMPDAETPIDLRAHLDSVDVSALDPPNPLVPYALSVPLHGAGPWLPPSGAFPWWLEVAEGGDPGLQGRVDAFSIESGSTSYVTDALLPAGTAEGAPLYFWVPGQTTSLPERPSEAAAVLRASPNPFRSQVRIRIAGPDPFRLAVYDALGREVRVLAVGAGETATEATWDGTDGRARPVAAGRYFLRLDAGARRTVVTLVRLP
jgi:hypothetical protein